jgi:hypothetical protein
MEVGTITPRIHRCFLKKSALIKTLLAEGRRRRVVAIAFDWSLARRWLAVLYAHENAPVPNPRSNPLFR